jgi:pimeloyl-ACP methyl ester carboxylesterase
MQEELFQLHCYPITDFLMFQLLVAFMLCSTASAVGNPESSTPLAPSSEQAIQLETKVGVLYGVVDLPRGAGPFPVVVSIAGSGPTDRDGNQPRLKNDSLRLLGQGLAAEGIAVLRYDRRGIGQSRKTAPKEEDLRFDILADDAAAWVKLLRQDKRFSQVGIIGHSEGALVAVLAAQRAPVDALVSLAGAGRSIPLALREQLKKNLTRDLQEKSDKIIDELAAGRTVPDPPRQLAALFRPSVQPFLISKFKYDPAKEIARLKMPVLIVQGTTDPQTPLADAKLLAAAKKDARLVVIEGMTHTLKKAATQVEQFKAYFDPSVPLAPELVKEVAAFLKEAFGKPRPTGS